MIKRSIQEDITIINIYAPNIATGEGNGTPFQYSCLENPMDRGAWWAAVHGVAESLDMTGRLHFHFSLSCIGEGNGNPLQCSCLENPRDGGACWAAVYVVAQSRTRLKRLSINSNIAALQYVRQMLTSMKEEINNNTIIGEGNGTPLQCSCLENPMDGGAW